MTPENARKELERSLPEYLRGDYDRYPEARSALHTVASMHYEYAAHVPDVDGEPRLWMGSNGYMNYQEHRAYWTPHLESLKQHEDCREHYIIVRRLVSPSKPYPRE